ncbi:MAG: sigma 54-interacting transcriptional regulator [Ignavibacteriaceae bacterium]|nr:sigma 54-interacting transcriptional regulator [Ignavibacteriaceae bacterium]
MKNYLNNIPKIKTLGELIDAGYKQRSVKTELRENLIKALNNGQNPFPGIFGYDETVIPDLEKAILSRHNILLLGLRGQAKTRIARQLTNLLDEFIPIVKGTEINDDPFDPISGFAKDKISRDGNNTEIEWLHRSNRYTEKLATPDVTVADLIGDLDPIKAASNKLNYSDERAIHFGLIPRSHRSIFVLNEIPDLQARIQVSLFNILQEEDIQIRGFKMRLPLDIAFVFTANPEDYTNRGSIVTPLKDRIESQILTHYPRSIEVSKKITRQEAVIPEDIKEKIRVSGLIEDLIEQIAFEARASELVDSKSGVSARLTITAFENLFSTAHRRILKTGEDKTSARISDLYGVIPAITGKIELVYEGEQEGPSKVAFNLIGKAIRSTFLQMFPTPQNTKKGKEKSVYSDIMEWYGKGNYTDFLNTSTNMVYAETLRNIPRLDDIIKKYYPELSDDEKNLYMEFVLHGLAECSMLSKSKIESRFQFRDLISSMFSGKSEQDDFDADDFTDDEK